MNEYTLQDALKCASTERCTLTVEVISNENNSFMVSDGTAQAYIVFDSEADFFKKIMKVGEDYKVIGGIIRDSHIFIDKTCFIFPLQNPFLPPKNKDSYDFTTNELLKIDKNNTKVEAKMLVKVENVYKPDKKKVIKQSARIKDEFNHIYLTAFQKNISMINKLKIGSIYQISNFVVNIYINKVMEKEVSIKINKESIIEEVIKPNLDISKRYDKIKSLDTAITGIITDITDINTYKGCHKCNRRVNLEPIYILRQDGSLDAEQKACKCGEIVIFSEISKNNQLVDYFVAKIIIQNKEDIPIIVFKDKMEDIKMQVEECGWKYNTDSDFLMGIKGMKVQIMYEQKFENDQGIYNNYLKSISLIDTMRDYE